MRKLISPETRAEIRTARARGETYKSIGARCGVSISSAARVIRTARAEYARGMAHAAAKSSI